MIKEERITGSIIIHSIYMISALEKVIGNWKYPVIVLIETTRVIYEFLFLSDSFLDAAFVLTMM